MHERNLAVIGTGVAGLTAAHVLSRSARVTVFEADARPGGHAHTHDVRLSDGQSVPVDSGFIVHNDRTYPTLQRLFRELDVPTQETDMSMSVSEPHGWQYAGGKGLTGILADPATVRRPAYLRMLTEVRRFHRAAHALLARPAGADTETIGEWIGDRYSRAFRTYFLRPLVACVWSCDPARALDYPARSLLTFLDHHGMLSVTGSPTWRTVQGGSRTYVERVLSQVREVRLSAAVLGVRRHADAVAVRDATGAVHDYDGVVIATHPHQALEALDQPTATESAVLGAMPYSTNTAVLHTDSSVLPASRRAWASWNYRRAHDTGGGVLVTYDLTRLMRLPDPGGQRVLVTLNDAGQVDDQQVVARMRYEHPLYTLDALRAQRRLPELNDGSVAFAGAYHGWGFHEDGALSGLQAAQALGGQWL